MLVSFIRCVFMDQDEVEVNKYSTEKAWSIRIYYMTKLRVQINAIKPRGKDGFILLSWVTNQNMIHFIFPAC